MRINSITSHYFVFGWSAAKIKSMHRQLVARFHPDRAQAELRGRYTRIMQDVNAESDFVKQYPGDGAKDGQESVYQSTDQHLVDIDPAAAQRAAAAAAEAQRQAEAARRAAEREAARRAAEAAQAERERIKRETAERVARENAERRRRAEEEAARFVPGSAPQEDTPRWRVKQERMF